MEAEPAVEKVSTRHDESVNVMNHPLDEQDDFFMLQEDIAIMSGESQPSLQELIASSANQGLTDETNESLPIADPPTHENMPVPPENRPTPAPTHSGVLHSSDGETLENTTQQVTTTDSPPADHPSSIQNVPVPPENRPTPHYDDLHSSDGGAPESTIPPTTLPIAPDTRIADTALSSSANSTVSIPAKLPIPPAPSKKRPPVSSEVIEIIDDDDSDDVQDSQQIKRPRNDQTSRLTQLPNWMKKTTPTAAPVVPGQALNLPSSAVAATRPIHHTPAVQPIIPTAGSLGTPQYLDLPPGFVPTWTTLMPPPVQPPPTTRRKAFELSLLSVRDFTITGLPVDYEGPPTPIAGLRPKIKQISRGHGKAVYERNEDGSGRWRIPLGAYHAFMTFLKSDPVCHVVGIPDFQLRIASLGKARLEKGYPTVDKLIRQGVPRGLASTLAPFQRGGVDFVIEKNGRALIADEMGLGKTIQGIASMAVYHEEWPVLVLTPSSARYHWAGEFKHWLGADSSINDPKNMETTQLEATSDDEDSETHDHESDASSSSPQRKAKRQESQGESEEESRENDKPPMELLKESQIHVVSNSKEAVIPDKDVRVVICSYGLAPTLAQSYKIVPGMFKCAIVDESHMLKNIKTKRTSALVPVLSATNRCVLLSGTPALAKPAELWPQLKILQTDGWWHDEAEFFDKYVKRGSRRAELHAMLTGTVMIRRMKADILKSLPQKEREKATVHVSTGEMRKEFHECMLQLRKGKGVLAKFARQHSALQPPPEQEPSPSGDESGQTEGDENGQKEREAQALAHLQEQVKQRHAQGTARIQHTLQTTPHALDPLQTQQFISRMQSDLQAELTVFYQEGLHRIKEQSRLAPGASSTTENGSSDENSSRKTLLSRMYSLTGQAKIPIVVKMLKKWLADPTKGKLCIFAHHIFVLNEIAKQSGLSNKSNSETKFIRIEGSTAPKSRQEQINAFQTDPSVRIALLGITAAGVAVTLTAASNVWFAELFWTPAIMIQAEDRCHRIGQQATVRCLYFAAKGTLDDVLWKLIAKKFEDLGEFVEGKEKLKMVVSKTYDGEADLNAMFATTEHSGDSDDADGSDTEDPDEDFLEFENELQMDISALAKEEEAMLVASTNADDDVDPGSETKSFGIPPVASSNIGLSEEAAILLSDDDDENETPPAPKSSDVADAPKNKDIPRPNGASAVVPAWRIYKLLVTSPTLGIEVTIYNCRVVVTSKTAQSQKSGGKPAIGDIIVGINGKPVPPVSHLNEIMTTIRSGLRRPPIELTFAEDEGFASFFVNRLTTAVANAQQKAFPRSQNQNKEEAEVIELD